MNRYGFTPKEFDKPCYVEEYYEAVEYLEDHRFGDIVLMQNKTNKADLLMLKEKFSNNLHDCERDIFQARDRLGLNHPCLLRMVDYSTRMLEEPDKEAEFLVCGYYEYPESDLEREIEARKNNNEYYSQLDLLKMIDNILDCLAFLQEGKMVHGDVRPKYIDFKPYSDERCCKLLDRMGDPHPPNQVQLKNMRRNYSLYMSPSLYKCLAQKENKVRHNPYKSDVFSLGVIVLEAGLLHSVQDIYDNELKDVNIEVLLGHLDEFCTIYDNDIVKEIVCLLLDLDEKTRKDPKHMLEQFRQLLNQGGEVVEEEVLEAEEVDLQENVEEESLNIRHHDDVDVRDNNINLPSDHKWHREEVVTTNTNERGVINNIPEDTVVENLNIRTNDVVSIGDNANQIRDYQPIRPKGHSYPAPVEDDEDENEEEGISFQPDTNHHLHEQIVKKNIDINVDIVLRNDISRDNNHSQTQNVNQLHNQIVESHAQKLPSEGKPSIPHEQLIEKVNIDMHFDKRDDLSHSNKINQQFDFEHKPKIEVHASESIPRELRRDSNVSKPIEMLTSDSKTNKVEQSNNLNQTPLETRIEKPNDTIIYNEHHLNNMKKEEDESELPKEEVTIDMRFDKREDPTHMDKKNLQFDFEGPPQVKVGEGMPNDKHEDRHKHNLPEESITIDMKFDKREDPVHMDKKNLEFDFNKPPHVKVHTEQPSLETKEHNINPNLPVETVEINTSFNKREDPAHMDKKNWDFDFERPPHVKVHEEQSIIGNVQPIHNTEHEKVDIKLEKPENPIRVDKKNSDSHLVVSPNVKVDSVITEQGQNEKFHEDKFDNITINQGNTEMHRNEDNSHLHKDTMKYEEQTVNDHLKPTITYNVSNYEPVSSKTVNIDTTFMDHSGIRYSSTNVSHPVATTYIKKDARTGVETRITTYTTSYLRNRESNTRVNEDGSHLSTSNYDDRRGPVNSHHEYHDDERRFVSHQLLSTVDEKKTQVTNPPNTYLSRISEVDSTKERSQISNPGPTIIRYQYGQPDPRYNYFTNDQKLTDEMNSKKELYMAPTNYTELKKSIRETSPFRVSDVKTGTNNREVNTYNYEYYTEPGTNIRRYVLKRNPAKPILQSNIQQSTQISSYSNYPIQKKESGITGLSIGSLVIDDDELEKRYAGLELREDNPKYKVYRVVSPNQQPRISEVRGEPQRISINRTNQTYTVRRECSDSYNTSR